METDKKNGGIENGGIEHGGDPASAEARFGRPEFGWLDLSTGINPRAYPVPPIPASAYARLPRHGEEDVLVAAARKAYGVPDDAAVVCAAGAQALIRVIPSLFARNEVTILGPTYGEHARAWNAAGHRVVDVGSICSQAVHPAPCGVVVHPNNPDGHTQSIEGLLAFADELFDRGGALVVDEAFVDVTPQLSVTPHVGRDGLIVLRSFGKFFGLAGVRLGFAVTSSAVAETLRAKLGPWAVSGPAIWAGTCALRDQDWIATTRTHLKSDAARLDALLQDAGLDVSGGTDLFRLVESAHAGAVYEKLARRGVLVRAFTDNARRLRFGLPGCERDWTRLEAALAL